MQKVCTMHVSKSSENHSGDCISIYFSGVCLSISSLLLLISVSFFILYPFLSRYCALCSLYCALCTVYRALCDVHCSFVRPFYCALCTCTLFVFGSESDMMYFEDGITKHKLDTQIYTFASNVEHIKTKY